MQNEYNKEQLLNYFSIRELLNGLDVKIKKLLEIRLDREILYSIYVDNMDYLPLRNEIQVAYQTQNDTDTYYLYMPFEYLYSEDWEYKAIKAHKKEKKREELLKQQREAEKIKKAEELEYEKYLELKKKYESE